VAATLASACGSATTPIRDTLLLIEDNFSPSLVAIRG